MKMYRLNDFMRVRLGDPVICDLLLERKSVKVPDTRVFVSARTSAASHG